MIDTILVPQGAEYQAVCRGLGSAQAPVVVPIPVGPVALSRYLKIWQHEQVVGKKLLVMGLCGGLVPHQAIADLVLYRECINGAAPCAVLPCDAALFEWLKKKLPPETTAVRALTSDRLVWSAQEKHQLAQQYGAGVVDMEGFAVLESLHQSGAAIAMVRVVSDNAQHDLPNLTNAIAEDGNLQPLPLAWGMIRQPIAAARLVRGSLKGLKTLQAIAKQLVNEQ